MRIAQLSLLAFGPFHGLEIDLSAPGLHVVFGRNEAGKSTTLRAITGLLYGIPVKTLDAHVHKMGDLRIGGVLAGDDGSRLRVVRRKGSSNTLLDEGGAVLDDALLQRLLHGVSEDTFRHAFGLDHDTLKKGAEALLDGKGDIAGSLFDASVGGGADVRRLQGELEKEADEIYRPRGSTQALNVALKNFTDLSKAVKEKEQLPSAYLAQEDDLKKTQALHTKQRDEREELARRQRRIESARQRVPLERRRAAASATLASLATALAHAPRIAELSAGLASYELAKKAHEEESAAAERLRIRVADAAVRAGVAAPLKITIDVRLESRIQKQSQERAASEQRLAATRTELARAERELAQAEKDAPAPAASDDVALATLRKALADVTKLGDGPAQLVTQRARASRKRAEVEQRAASLVPFRGSLDALAVLEPPALASLEALASRLADNEKHATRVSDLLATIEQDSQRLERQVAEASGDFAPPTAADLRASRDARRTILQSVQHAPISSLEFSAIERAVHGADDVADRMIAAADRVLVLARQAAQQVTHARQRQEANAELGTLEAARAALLAEHRALWLASRVIDEAVALDALGLAGMRAWLGKREQLLEHLRDVRDAEADAEELARSIATARDQLAAALGEQGELDDLALRAKARLDRDEQTRRAAERSADSIGKQRALIADAAARAALEETALLAVRSKLAELVAPFGLGEDADAEEITHALDALRELGARSAELAATTDRALLRAREVLAFEEQTALATRTFAEDLAGLGASQIVKELAERRTQVLAAKGELAHVDAELAEHGDSAATSDDIRALVADPEATRQALDELASRLDDADQELQRAAQDIGGREHGLRIMRAESGAAEIAAQAQEALARVRDGFERYVRAKSAALLLSREIERYREENQGPLLTMASKLFARLTLGSFEGIRAGFDERDKAALRCVRPGNVEVDVTGLSEGTRDQLYLSLRLASLLRYADMAEPLPLVLDDVLIQFDDERSRAALSVIAEVAGRMQVLFFTHHARMTDLAKAAVPAGSLTIHELAHESAMTPERRFA